MYPFNTLRVCYRHNIIEDVREDVKCFRIFFDKFTTCLTQPIYDHCTYSKMVNSAYFVKSTHPIAFKAFI